MKEILQSLLVRVIVGAITILALIGIHKFVQQAWQQGWLAQIEMIGLDIMIALCVLSLLAVVGHFVLMFFTDEV